ncbi:competence type IV pilus minor pilin ComGF [Siminovitchia sediminis]|uniref:Competence type IV pilus minor pilin ComGF n=1 Tax=Siminovitchia sediminis TaxID=1274353 RepID=A0ABW4KD92_9BACI
MKKNHIVWSNRSGFTLLETIFSIFIVSVILSLLPLLYYWFFSIDRALSVEGDFEWNTFLIQLRKELETADTIFLRPERMYLTKNHSIIKYERFQRNIRRQVDDKGQEIVLQNVRRFSVREEFPMFVIEVEFMNGKTDEARFRSPPIEEGT